MIIAGTAKEILELSERIKRGEFDKFKTFASMPGQFGIKINGGMTSVFIAKISDNKAELIAKVH